MGSSGMGMFLGAWAGPAQQHLTCHVGACSVDSAELRAAEAEARLRDYGATTSQPKVNTGLPSALDAFTEVCSSSSALEWASSAATCIYPKMWQRVADLVLCALPASHFK
jgi:hypothetical protein